MTSIERYCPNCGEKFLGRTDRPGAFCSHTCAAIMRQRERTLPLANRFWKHVQKGQATECWEWQSSRHPLGYGQFGMKGSAVHAHRVAWELANGPVENGLYVLHKCDNRACCNPDHLFLGTQKDNVRDMMEKGRWKGGDFTGEKSHFAVLTNEQVADIRAKLAAGKRGIGRTLAKEYNVSEGTISYIKHGHTWTSTFPVTTEQQEG